MSDKSPIQFFLQNTEVLLFFSPSLTVAKVKFIREIVSNGSGVLVYECRVLTNYTVSCAVPPLQVGQKIFLYTDMTSDCKCPVFTSTLTLGMDYLVGGHYGTDGKWRLRTKKPSGGCILSKWKTKYEDKLEGWLKRAKPVSCSG